MAQHDLPSKSPESSRDQNRLNAGRAFARFRRRKRSGARVHNLTAQALAHEIGCPLIIVDCEEILTAAYLLTKLVPSIRLHPRLWDMAICLDRIESLFDPERRQLPEAVRLISAVTSATRSLVLLFFPSTHWQEVVKSYWPLPLAFDDLPSAEPVALWHATAAEIDVDVSCDTLTALKNGRVLRPSQIRAATDTVRGCTLLSPSGRDGSVNDEVWFRVARFQSETHLRELANQVQTSHTWNQLVLPPVVVTRFKQIATAIRHRVLTDEEWGFDERLLSGNGFPVLLGRLSGTGKTMTDGMMAHTLGLDIYKIDLSSSFSKCIGETEKNLDRIFHAAQCSPANLFFDEADALFSKQSEGKDAHDRYANIEVSYLLQNDQGSRWGRDSRYQADEEY